MRFVLHGGLEPELVGPGALSLVDRGEGPGGLPLERYEIVPPPGARTFALRYAGELHHRVERVGEAYARGFDVSPGIVGPDGVYLAGASHWFVNETRHLVVCELPLPRADR